jgi:hypothetical protein
MKRTLFFYLLSVVCFFSACKKEQFDFSHLNNIDAAGEYGIPLLHLEYSVEQLVSQMEANNFLLADPNGNIFLQYIIEQNHIILDSSLFSFEDVSTTYDWSKQIPPVPISGIEIEEDTTFQYEFVTKDMIIHSGIIRSGRLVLTAGLSLVRFTMSCDQIIAPDGNPLVLSFDDQTQHVIDLTGYTINFAAKENNTFDFHLSYSIITQTGVSEYACRFEAALSNLRIQEVLVKLGKVEKDFDQTVNIKSFFQNSHYGGRFIIYDPKIKLQVHNGFNLNGNLSIEQLQFENTNQQVPILNHYPTDIYLTADPDDETELNSLSQIPFSSDFESLKIKGRAILNPQGFDAGYLTVHPNASVGAKVDIQVPFKTNIEQLYYYDTMAFSLDTVQMPNIIENLSFRLALENKLPLSLQSQLIFYDSKEDVKLDSLFSMPYTIQGSYNTSPITTSTIVEVNANRLTKILQADKLILRIQMNTESNVATLNYKQSIKVRLGMKIKYNLNGLEMSEIKTN